MCSKAGSLVEDEELGSQASSQNNGGFLGYGCRAEELLLMAGKSRRFPIRPSEEEEDRQFDCREKLLGRLKFPACCPKTEEELESWVDEAAQIVCRFRACPALFHEAWVLACQGAVKEVVGDSVAEEYEDIVTAVSLKLFPTSRYVVELEELLFFGKAQETVLEAECWLRRQASRYVRLCRRRERDISISNHRLRESAERCFPQAVRMRLIKESFEGDVASMLKRAHRIQSDLLRVHKTLPEPLGVMATDRDESVGSRRRDRPPEERGPKCTACGEDHATKTCRFRAYRCMKCRQVGHIKRVCPNTVVYDTRGRVATRVENKKGSTNVVVRKDRTMMDKLVTVEDVLEMFKKLAEGRSAKAKVKRGQGTSEVKKKRRSEVPAKVVDKATSSDASSYSSDEKVISAAEELVGTQWCGEGSSVSSTSTKLTCTIKGKRLLASLDECEDVNVCGQGVARANGLCLKKVDPMEEVIQCRTDILGAASVTLSVRGLCKEVKVYVLEDEGVPLTLGRSAMSLFRL